MQRRRVQRAIVSVALVAAVVVAFAFRGALGRATLAGAIDVATGYRVAFDDVVLGREAATFGGARISYAGVSVLRARRIGVRYDLAQLVTRGAHRFGLLAVDVDGPELVLVRRPDGSFVTKPAGSGGPRAAVGSDAAPLAFTLTVRDGNVALIDTARAFAIARRLEVRDVDLRATVAEGALTRYRARGDLAGDRRQSFSLAGILDARRGYAAHRLHAFALDATAIANYFINAPAARVLRATARDLDVRAYAFAAPDGSLPYHLTGSATLDAGAMRVPGLVPVARDMRGRIDVFDGGLAAPSLRARLGTLADVRLAGGLYGWSAPAFRLGLVTAADASRARALFAFSRALPLRGTSQIATLLEGAAGKPLVATRVAAPRLQYGAYPIDGVAGRAIYYGGEVDVVDARGAYGGLGVVANGTVQLGRVARTTLVVDAAGPDDRVPYLAEAAPGARVDAVALLAGTGVQLDARGALAGSGGGASLGGVFHVDPAGNGALGPFSIERSDGASLAGSFYLRRAQSQSAFWLDARNYPYAALAASPHLPGVALTAPAFGGRLDGEVAGAGPPSAFRLAGRIGGRDVRVGSVAIDEVRASVTGALDNVGLAAVSAHGAWGSLRGRGSYRPARLALEGDYHGSFAELATLTGDLGARGPVAGPVTLLVEPRRTIVQTPGVSTGGARLRGLALGGAAGSLGIANGRLQIYGATGDLAGGTVAAAGRLGDGHDVGVSLAGVAAADAVSFAHLEPGRVAAIGRVALVGRRPTFSGGLAIGEAAFGDFPAAANGDVSLSAGRLQISGGAARLGAAVGTVDGIVADPGTPQAAYDLHVGVRSAELAPFAQELFPERRDIAGTGDANLRIRKTGSGVALAGTFAIPEGTFNGLAFGGLGARVALDRSGFDVRDGTLTVGSTRTAFAGSFHGSEASARLDAPHADLADFNDFFDGGDTLGGRGRVAARFYDRAETVTTNADIAIAGLHYRRFDLGDARAAWTSSGPRVRGSVAFGGASGTLVSAGTLQLDLEAPLEELAARSRFDGTARLRGLDLGVWLPALGYQVPLGGRVDADATIAGPLGDPDFRTNATLANGTIGAFPIDRLIVEASSTLRRTTIKRAELDLPSLALTASGTLGVGASAPLALQIHAKSANLSSLATRLLGARGTIAGEAEADVRVAGTRRSPRVTGGFDVEAATFRGVAVPRALGEFSLHGRDVVLSAVEVGFATGRLDLAGSVPLEIAPFGFGPAAAPVALEAALRGIDLASFAPLLPAGSTLGGRLDGEVAVAGTAGSPQLDGAITLAGGTLRTPAETIPLDGIAARVAFAGKTATLETLHANAGGGTLDGRGSATFADLVRPQTRATYAFRATANRVHLNFPAYGDGQVDGFLTLAEHPAALPLLGGDLSFSDATIPFSALLLAASGSSGQGLGAGTADTAPVLPLAFDFDVDADRNVRVRSANVDIGATGGLHVGGTRAAPSLEGDFASTGGTLTYFNTVFRLIDGTVAFSPENGVIPTLDAHAVTHVINPDPNTVRNAAGSADVTLALTGAVNSLSIALSSDPAYDRQQILGLLFNAPALGASNLFGETSQNPTLYGSNSTAGLSPAVATNRNTSGELSVAQEAFGIANAQFTRALLAPIETTVAEAVGLSNLNVNVDYTGSVGVEARKVLGKKVNALFGTSFGYPYRQSFGFEVKPSESEAAQLTVFQTLGATNLNSLTPTTSLSGASTKLQASQPTYGNIGFSFSLQRLFP